eukprot:CAMPEP_0171461604 /NCGR_PEP_ID=MMETSP0945-20130129/5983_1 /TAXON_ID=109269 /ORGANISM="Vaucheria litorea, Strain CCMP2940" /LENGTH=310 /DNA_ID=CAMNT_0011987979 /DNA_START=130 /DNA_END=1062 /DNA_ORIENTATION=+
MSLRGLARKSKESEIALFKASLHESSPDSAVWKYMEEGSSDSHKYLRPKVLSDSIRKMPGTLSVISEYRRNMKSGFVTSILEPEIMSPMFREGGASAVAVAIDKNYGGCNESDAMKIFEEQKTAANDFPPSLPIVVRDLVVDPIQIAYAKSLGAVSITLLFNLVEKAKIKLFLDFAGALNMECVVQVSSEEEIKEAIELGSTIVSITGKSLQEAIDLKKMIPDDVAAVIQVDRRSDEGLEEIEDCWKLRDAGFNSIWASEILYKAGQMQSESVTAIIKAIRAKGSVKYGRARGMSGKGEGAKEFLGTLET